MDSRSMASMEVLLTSSRTMQAGPSNTGTHHMAVITSSTVHRPRSTREDISSTSSIRNSNSRATQAARREEKQRSMGSSKHTASSPGASQASLQMVTEAS